MEFQDCSQRYLFPVARRLGILFHLLISLNAIPVSKNASRPGDCFPIARHIIAQNKSNIYRIIGIILKNYRFFVAAEAGVDYTISIYFRKHDVSKSPYTQLVLHIALRISKTGYQRMSTHKTTMPKGQSGSSREEKAWL